MSLPDAVHALFAAPNFAHLATLGRDGAPYSTPIWADVRDGRVVFFARADSAHGRNMARDPRVALSVVDLEDPYRAARLRGRAHVLDLGPGRDAFVHAMAHKYTSRPYADPIADTVTVYAVEASATSAVGYSDVYAHRPGGPA